MRRYTSSALEFRAHFTSTRFLCLSGQGIRCIQSTSISEVFCHGLFRLNITHALPRLSIVEPAMKRAHDAVRVDHLASYPQVSPHVHAIRRQSIDLLVSAPVDHDVVTVDVDGFDTFGGHLLGTGNVVPAVRIGR
jgi:hypothetical protein